MSGDRPERLAAGIFWQWIQVRFPHRRRRLTVIKHYGQANLQKKELTWVYSVGGLTFHHCRKLRQVVVGTAESSHLQLQAEKEN